MFSAKVASKILQKLAAKGSVKAMGAASGGAFGTAVCSWAGPGALVCGGLTAIAAWIITDEIAIKLEDVWNRKEFETEIGIMIDQHKKSIKNEIKDGYKKIYEAISEEAKERIDPVSLLKR